MGRKKMLPVTDGMAGEVSLCERCISWEPPTRKVQLPNRPPFAPRWPPEQHPPPATCKKKRLHLISTSFQENMFVMHAGNCKAGWGWHFLNFSNFLKLETWIFESLQFHLWLGTLECTWNRIAFKRTTKGSQTEARKLVQDADWHTLYFCTTLATIRWAARRIPMMMGSCRQRGSDSHLFVNNNHTIKQQK